METEAIAIAEALGGEQVLGKRVTKTAELTKIVRRGLPAKAIVRLAAKLNLASTNLSLTLRIPQRTLTRRLGGHGRLTPSESDRAVRLARLYAIAVDVLGDQQKAVGWLLTPNRALSGERPIEQTDTDVGARTVEDILGRITYGVYS